MIRVWVVAALPINVVLDPNPTVLVVALPPAITTSLSSPFANGEVLYPIKVELVPELFADEFVGPM
jgi:hypothetical protein